ncbi:MAG: LysE family transporter [Chloroflexota bacterium]|nr:LysE family transporter [Chloroflexota bacterium]
MDAGQAGLIFGTSFVVGLSGAVTPGPLLAYNIRETARRGFWAGPWIATGHSILEAAVVALLAVGALQFMQGDVAFATVALIGGGFLLWMGYGMVRHPGIAAPAQLAGGADGPVQARRFNHPLLGGIAVSLANPFWIVWWATIGLNYIHWSQTLGLGLLGIAAFYVGHILADYAWYGLVSAGIASGRRILTDSFYRGLILACGLFLWAMAGYFVFNGVSRVV